MISRFLIVWLMFPFSLMIVCVTLLDKEDEKSGLSEKIISDRVGQ